MPRNTGVGRKHKSGLGSSISQPAQKQLLTAKVIAPTAGAVDIGAVWATSRPRCLTQALTLPLSLAGAAPSLRGYLVYIKGGLVEVLTPAIYWPC